MSESSSSFQYAGGELALFASAHNWKRYWAGRLEPYIGQNVLEVGAGLGLNREFLDKSGRHWTWLEPDAAMAAHLREKARLLPGIWVIEGMIDALPRERYFDTIVYIDVLEHIQDDRCELHAAAERLSRGGHLIVLAPAHGFLFSIFDISIGHQRRYNASSLKALTPPGLELASCYYLDCIGLLGSLWARFGSRHNLPSAKQIAFWDRVMIPISRIVDPLLGYRLGKTIVAVWRRS